MFALPLLVSIANAGPWARPAGEVWTKVGAGRFTGQAAFDQDAGRSVTTSAELYGEVGLGRGFEIDALVMGVDQRAGGLVRRGLQDIELMMEWSPGSGSSVVALLGGLRISPYARGREIEIGPGGTDVLAGAAWGRGFGPGWGIVEGLLRRRVGTVSTGLRLRTEWGVISRRGDGIAVELQLQPAFGRQDDDPTGPAPVPRVFAVGPKVFLAIAGPVGLIADASWLPPFFNDGPGTRVGVGLTLQGG